MSVRLFALMILGFTVFLWSMVPTMTYLPELARIGAHLFYASASVCMLHGIVTGKAPA